MTANNVLVIDTDQFFTRLEEALERKLAERLAQQKAQEPAETLPELLTRRDVARYFQISIATVDNLTKAGVLEKHYLAGQPRFKRDEVRKALEGWKKYQRG
ncbi:MAG: helix-turn-helix domain-containing protein [Saprospiraceae bacterium]